MFPSVVWSVVWGDDGFEPAATTDRNGERGGERGVFARASSSSGAVGVVRGGRSFGDGRDKISATAPRVKPPPGLGSSRLGTTRSHVPVARAVLRRRPVDPRAAAAGRRAGLSSWVRFPPRPRSESRSWPSSPTPSRGRRARAWAARCTCTSATRTSSAATASSARSAAPAHLGRTTRSAPTSAVLGGDVLVEPGAAVRGAQHRRALGPSPHLRVREQPLRHGRRGDVDVAGVLQARRLASSLKRARPRTLSGEAGGRRTPARRRGRGRRAHRPRDGHGWITATR